MSYLHSPRPFKNPNYTKNTNRRTKNLKTVLGQEREKERVERERRRQERDSQAMDIDEVKKELVEANEEISTCELITGFLVGETDSFRSIDRSTTICSATETLLRYYGAGG